MAKEPQAGKTKTRLSPPLSGQEAAELYRCLLLDTLELMHRVKSAQHVIAYSPYGAESFFQRLAPPGFDFTPQVGADLGALLDNVTTHYLQNGYRQVVVVDSDSPTLPEAYLNRAFRELDDPSVDVVLGPADDGGYYLVGLKVPCPALFLDVSMSTATVIEETLERAREQGLQVAFLAPWYDVDTCEDLDRLIEELATSSGPMASHTRTFLVSTGRMPRSRGGTA
jgi:rSAM/selenodomain-associated transferase 1